MKVKVNNTKITIFSGAKVKDAVWTYYAQNNKLIPDELPEVRDAYGNVVDGSGALSEGAKLFIPQMRKKCILQRWFGKLK